MGKSSGGVRGLGSREQAKKNRKIEYNKELASGKYDIEKSYFDEKSGGYYLTEKSTMKHKKEEVEVANFLAKKGYKVKLIDETGQEIVVDGKIFKTTYEQRTPEGGSVNNMKNALIHAAGKKAKVALVYMKKGLHTRKTVEEGIKEFEKLDWRFKEIIIVTKSGKIHIHKHNK